MDIYKKQLLQNMLFMLQDITQTTYDRKHYSLARSVLKVSLHNNTFKLIYIFLKCFCPHTLIYVTCNINFLEAHFVSHSKNYTVIKIRVTDHIFHFIFIFKDSRFN